MILLDTHAVVWLAHGHRRARPLAKFPRLYLSPVSVLEIQFLIEAGRLRLSNGRSPGALAADGLWKLDEPPAEKWFSAACDFSWTRDPFDRLLAAHARVRGWKLATADDLLLERLAPSEVVAL
ncbi:MAG TPA: PIN domain-containing protein [Vicinamibacterales bacterium]|nr:PIN domain-containing protein [Vicinamibacterales bacterium]